MLNNNFSSLNKQVSNTTYTRTTKSINKSNCSVIPLATAAFCLLSFHQSALAIDIETQIAANKATSSNSRSESHGRSHEYKHHHNSDGLLSRILRLVAYPFISQSSTLPEADLPAKNFPFHGMGGSSVKDMTPLYLSEAGISSTKEFLTSTTIQSIQPADNLVSATVNLDRTIYKVKPGDTIDRIANRYKVSPKELIALNQIEDSNVIFTKQELKLPVTKLDSLQSEKITLTKASLPQNAEIKSNFLNTSDSNAAETRLNSPSVLKLSSKNNSTKDLQAERLVNLKADINRLRAEIKRDKNDNEDLDKAKINVVSSANPERDRQLDLMAEETISLKLPPLPSSEEYLPEAFDGYSWPAQGVLSSGYGWRWGRLHKGIDIAAPVGTPVFAAAAGEVVSAGWNSGGYGNLIKLQHLDGSITLYAHNHRILVNNGQKVSGGQQIAEMGNTGFSTGSHLHFEIHSRNRGVVNPLTLLVRK